MKIATLLVLAAVLAFCAFGLMNTFDAGQAGADVWKMRALYAAGAILSIGLLVKTTLALFKQIVLLVLVAALAYYWFFVR